MPCARPHNDLFHTYKVRTTVNASVNLGSSQTPSKALSPFHWVAILSFNSVPKRHQTTHDCPQCCRSDPIHDPPVDLRIPTQRIWCMDFGPLHGDIYHVEIRGVGHQRWPCKVEQIVVLDVVPICNHFVALQWGLFSSQLDHLQAVFDGQSCCS